MWRHRPDNKLLGLLSAADVAPDGIGKRGQGGVYVEHMSSGIPWVPRLARRCTRGMQRAISYSHASRNGPQLIPPMARARKVTNRSVNKTPKGPTSRGNKPDASGVRKASGWQRYDHPLVGVVEPAQNVLSDDTHGRGRPKVHVDHEALYEAAKSRASFATLSKIFGVDDNTLQRPPLREVIEKARAVCDMRLYDAQHAAAVIDRNPAMLIWCGKQHLGQRDVTRIEQTGADGKELQAPVTKVKAVAYFPDNKRGKAGKVEVVLDPDE